MYQLGQGGEPEPVRGLVADRARELPTKLSRTYRRSGRYVDAARCCLEAIDILETIPGYSSALATQTRAALAEIGEIPVPSIEERERQERRLVFTTNCAGAVDAETVAMRERGPAENVEQAWEILTAADQSAQAVLAEVLMSPLTGVWIVRMLRRLRGAATDRPNLSTELGYLGSLAAAVAIRSQSPCALTVPSVDGVVTSDRHPMAPGVRRGDLGCPGLVREPRAGRAFDEDGQERVDPGVGDRSRSSLVTWCTLPLAGYSPSSLVASAVGRV